MHFIFLFSSLSPLKFPEFPPFKIFKRLIPPPQSPILLPKKIPAKSETTRAKLNPPLRNPLVTRNANTQSRRIPRNNPTRFIRRGEK